MARKPKRPGLETKYYQRRPKQDVPVEHGAIPKLGDPAKEEVLNRFVTDSFGQTNKASDLEERTARALDKAGITYHFFYQSWPSGSGFNPLDFLVLKDGVAYQMPVNDTQFIHRGQEGHDERINGLISAVLRRDGFNLFPQVITLTDLELSNQDDANRTIEELFL